MFLQIVELKTTTAPSMSNPHSHDYYELYFQLEGVRRQLFIKSQVYDLPAKALCVIPPFCVHQLDGSNYRRININISKDLLSEDELRFLDDCAKSVALKLDDDFLLFLEPLLVESAELYKSNTFKTKQYSLPLVKTILYFLQNHNLQAVNISYTQLSEQVDSLINKVILFLNENYKSRIDLKMLCEQFFISKATLCSRFKKRMNCSIMDYLLQLRLGKARSMLFNTNQSIENIAERCGFSSTNYFRSIFKEIVGIAPLHYRKHMRGEQKNPPQPNDI